MPSKPLSDDDIWGQKALSDEEVFGTKQMEPGIGREAAIAGTGLAKGAATGTLGLPGNIAEMYSRGIGMPFSNLLNRALGKEPNAQPTSFGLPTSQSVGQVGQQLGAWDRPELKPQGEGERLLYGGAQGVGAAVPWAAAGPGALATKLAYSGAGGAGAGVAGQAAQDYYPNSWPMKNTAVALASLFGGGAATGMASAADTALRGQPNEVLAAYDRQGLEPRLAGNVVDDPVMQRMQAKGATSPGGHNLAEEWNKSTNDFGKRVEAVADQISPASALKGVTTIQEAGEFIKNKGQDWLDNFSNQQNKLWKTVDQHIPQDTPVDLTPYKSVLDDITSRSPISGPVQPSLAKRLGAALSRENPGADVQSLSPQEIQSLEPQGFHNLDFNRGGKSIGPLQLYPEEQIVNQDWTKRGLGTEGYPQANMPAVSEPQVGLTPQELAAQPKQATIPSPFAQQAQPSLEAGDVMGGAKTWPEADWSDVKYLRTRIGELIRSKTPLPTNTSLGDLRRLYSGLSDSMDNAVSYMSPQAQSAYAAANTYTKTGHEFLDDTLAPFMKDTVLPEQVANRLLNSGNLGATKIAAMQQNIPDAVDALAAAKLHQSVQPTSSNTPKFGNYYMPGVADMAMDMSPEAYKALYGNYADVDDLVKISEAARKPLMIAPMGSTSEGGALPTHSTFGVGGHAVGGAMLGHELSGGNMLATGGGALGGALYGAAAPRIEGAMASAVAGTPAYTRYLATRPQVPFQVPGAEIPTGVPGYPLQTPPFAPYLPFALTPQNNG